MIEFLRYLFLISILAGSTSIGFLLSRSYSNRVRELKAFSKLVNIVKILYRMAPQNTIKPGPKSQ